MVTSGQGSIFTTRDEVNGVLLAVVCGITLYISTSMIDASTIHQLGAKHHDTTSLLGVNIQGYAR